MTKQQWVAVAVPVALAVVGALAPYLKDHPIASVVALCVAAAFNALKVQALPAKESE